MITPDQMREIMVKWSIFPSPVKVNGGSVGWLAKTIDGHRAGPKHVPYPTPEESIEAADIWLAARDRREEDTKSQRIIDALERGRYFIRPKNVQSTDEGGNPITVKVFSAFLPNGNATPVVDRSSFIQAVIDMETLLP